MATLANVLVVGGTGGLGRAIVELLRREEHGVAFTYIEAGAEAERLAGDTGAQAYGLDLRDSAAIERVAAAVESALGPIDGLVNAAGVRRDALAALTSDADWERVVDVNLGGAFRCCRAVLPGMVARRRGAIVNVASLSALHGVPGQAAYAASKAGLVGLTRSLAREVGRRGIRVNAVVPGFVATRMTEKLPATAVQELRRNECLPDGVTPAAVADAVLFLLSSRAAAITGQCLVVDAGASA